MLSENRNNFHRFCQWKIPFPQICEYWLPADSTTSSQAWCRNIANNNVDHFSIFRGLSSTPDGVLRKEHKGTRRWWWCWVMAVKRREEEYPVLTCRPIVNLIIPLRTLMALGQFQFIHDSPDIALCYHSLPDSLSFLRSSSLLSSTCVTGEYFSPSYLHRLLAGDWCFRLSIYYVLSVDCLSLDRWIWIPVVSTFLSPPGLLSLWEIFLFLFFFFRINVPQTDNRRTNKISRYGVQLTINLSPGS